MPVEIWKIYHRMTPPCILWNKKEPAEEAQGGVPGDMLYVPSTAGCPWPSVDLLSWSWSESAWAFLLKGVMSPTSIGHLISEFWMICTCPESSAKPGQFLLNEPLLGSVHYRLLIRWDLWPKNLLLGCCGWRSCGSVSSTGHSKRTAFLLQVDCMEAPTSGVPITWKSQLPLVLAS